MKTAIHVPLLALVALCLSACDERDKKSNTSPKAPAGQQAQAEQVDCPDDFGIPARPQGAPVDDILGVRLGVSLDNAVLFFRCQKNRTFTVIAEDRVLTGLDNFGVKRRDFTRIVDGVHRKLDRHDRLVFGYRARDAFDEVKEDITLLAVGQTNAELVRAIWRSEHFEKGKLPAAADLGKALIAKYGQPSVMNEASHVAHMRWVYDLYGRRIGKESPNFSKCAGAVSNASGSFSWDPACGLNIAATITKASDNELLASELAVAILDQAALDQAIETTNAAFAAADAQRKQRELNDAQKGGADVPQL